MLYCKSNETFLIFKLSKDNLSIPSNIQEQVHEINKFRSAVKGFLLLHSFYSLNEYYNYVTNG
jgi:hypothetical protein